MASVTIGDTQKVAKQPIAISLPQTVVSIVDLTDATSALNDASVSGKVGGATVMLGQSGVFTLYIAQGSETTDAWIAADGVTTQTPA